jgi:hypothetical protein
LAGPNNEPCPLKSSALASQSLPEHRRAFPRALLGDDRVRARRRVVGNATFYPGRVA